MRASRKEQRNSSTPVLDHQAVDFQIAAMFKVVQSGLHDAMDEALSQVGLTVPVYVAMLRLADEPAMSKAELARRSFVRPQSLTRVMAKLAEEGLISRPPHPDHGRILQTTLTPAGVERLQQADALLKPIIEGMLDGTSERERVKFLEMLMHCSERLRSES
jgi:DNA-binding MarR family transcriptional regulator